MKITVSDHKNVMDKVGVAAKDKWKALGSELRLSIDKLNGIEMQRQGDPLYTASLIPSTSGGLACLKHRSHGRHY